MFFWGDGGTSPFVLSSAVLLSTKFVSSSKQSKIVRMVLHWVVKDSFIGEEFLTFNGVRREKANNEKKKKSRIFAVPFRPKSRLFQKYADFGLNGTGKT